MILKKFLGKTVEAAKQSAQQMYGDDLSPLQPLSIDTDEHDGEDEPRDSQPNQQFDQGVRFERSSSTQKQPHNTASSKLKAIRKYAAQQMPTDADEEEQHNTINKEVGTDSSPSSQNQTNGTGSYYSRANIRPKKSDKQEPTTNEPPETGPKEFKLPDNPSVDITVSNSKDEKDITESATTDKTEVSELHSRFDELESLLHSALASKNSDYTAHPAFQKLLHTGIDKSTVSDWFSTIADKGIKPYEQTEKFMAELATIIREALDSPAPTAIKKHLLFRGLAGSGKTQLIMKLCQHPTFMGDQQVGVVSISPVDKSAEPYYTILESFCEDRNIPYCEAEGKDDVMLFREEWASFDHILIDTPSLPKNKEEALEQHQKLKKLLAPLSEVEIHCLIDASRNEFYNNQYTALFHEFDPDYLAITHLDETSQWGPLVPLLKKMKGSLRYVSSGTAVPGSINKFDPKWFTKKMLANA